MDKNYMNNNFETEDEIKRYLDKIKKYRASSKSLYYYNCTLSVELSQNYESAIDYSYKTLKAWNMDQRGAKLCKYEYYKASLLRCKEVFLTLQKCDDGKLYKSFPQDVLDFLFKELKGITQTTSKIVTISKTLHFFAPYAFPPIDRKYTEDALHFHIQGMDEEKQKNTIFEVVSVYRDYIDSHAETLIPYIVFPQKGTIQNPIYCSWNTTAMKICDNLLIAQKMLNGKNIKKTKENKKRNKIKVANMKKYDPLYEYLREKDEAKITLSFSKIEAILGSKLPNSARNYRAWWGNSPKGRYGSYSWYNAGYKVYEVSLTEEIVVFKEIV